MGNSLFDSLFSSESCVFFSQIHPPLKIYHVWLFIIIKKGLQWLLDNVGFVLSQVLNAEKLVFYSFWNPSMHTHALFMQSLNMRVHMRVCVHIS